MKNTNDLIPPSPPDNQPPTRAERRRLKRRFPKEIWQQLSGRDLRILEELCYLSKLKAKQGPSGAAYANPGREYLAKKAGCDIWQVSRSTSHLESLGIIEKIHRRKEAGRWQTVLYKVKHWFAWRANQIRSLIHSITHRVRKPAHIAPSGDKILTSEERKGEFYETLERFKQMGKNP